MRPRHRLLCPLVAAEALRAPISSDHQLEGPCGSGSRGLLSLMLVGQAVEVQLFSTTVAAAGAAGGSRRQG